jgi:hypothetical protein
VQSAPTPAKRFTLADIKTSGPRKPNAHFLYAVEGWGKTSLAAQTPSPIFIQSRGETGLETLIQNGLVSETPAFPECQSWSDINDAVDTLLHEQHPYKTLVMDTVNGAERLCHEHVCERDFGGDWGEHGFLSYGKGPKVSIADWLLLLQKLDRLRNEKGMTIFLLGHAKVGTFKNPQGADFDRYQAEMDKETYAVTAKWADSILFGNFETTVNQGKKAASDLSRKGKAVDVYRALFTQRMPAFDAKNRLGLPAEVEMGESPEEAWKNLVDAIKAGRVVATTEGATANA